MQVAGDCAPGPQAVVVTGAGDEAIYKALGDRVENRRPDAVIGCATSNDLPVANPVGRISAGVAAPTQRAGAHPVMQGMHLTNAEAAGKVTPLAWQHRAHHPIPQQAGATVRGVLLRKPMPVMGSAMFYKPGDYFCAAPWREWPPTRSKWRADE
jgi:hypothetical protein